MHIVLAIHILLDPLRPRMRTTRLRYLNIVEIVVVILQKLLVAANISQYLFVGVVVGVAVSIIDRHVIESVRIQHGLGV